MIDAGYAQRGRPVLLFAFKVFKPGEIRNLI
jgi:hypothetical protein